MGQQDGSQDAGSQSSEGQGTQGEGAAGSAAGQAQGTQTTGLEFIPEQYRAASWASKYTTPDDFFKGVDNLAKTVGQKQIVQGIQAPGDSATPEDWDKFFSQIGRPESADKYQLPEDVKAFQGFDIETEKKAFNDLAHKNGLSNKQAAGLWKDYIGNINQSYEKNQANQITLDQAKKEAFGDNIDEGYGLANKAAEALGFTDKINERGLGKDPLVLQLLAEVGKGLGEDAFVSKGNTGSEQSLLEQAKAIQASAEYQRGDQALYDKVANIYKQIELAKKK